MILAAPPPPHERVPIQLDGSGPVDVKAKAPPDVVKDKTVKPSDANAITDALPRCPSLQKLFLHDNMFVGDVTVPICPALRELHLQHHEHRAFNAGIQY